ncbi:hypothetical protein NLX83_15780 [Allokutzneria sp. A3M-2-11 16]|uniref:hypothetical protein n=1 Tax=Allokutzneria sp. A3M-2-11 16 TaxID=2962043 RepID=UPI0020B8F724|nr:hypothetical protein [Allokutzneria sp. A3M-2-11 16]MCP3800728.1 hypothetical protein [Allokutzneria sp. A3M-2-11 16]
MSGPEPLSLFGGDVPGLPVRELPLDEVRDLLLARRCPQAVRDAVWAELVHRSRSRGAAWTVGAVGVALPALLAVAARLTVRFAGDPSDIYAEVLGGFLAALGAVDVTVPRIMTRLRWAAFRAGHDALTDALSGPTPIAPLGFGSVAPRTPWGHPDVVLARAVRDGVVTEDEAALIGATRLEAVSVADWARAHEVGEWSVYKARRRAEHRLVTYLREQTASAETDDPVAAEAVRNLPGPSRAVTDARSRRRVSKTGAAEGVQKRGSTPPTASSEVPRCA